jgi:hypothetical protein
MAKTLQFRRYNTATLATTTGAAGELIVNSSNNSVTVHDGATVGGTELATRSYVATAISGVGVATITDDTTTIATHYPLLAISTSGTLAVANTSSSKLTFVPLTGLLTTTDINTTSDANLKENIETIQSATDVINNINGVSFNWKDTGKKSYGVIAQELQTILPELVNKNENGLSVSYLPLLAFLIQAVKEQDKRISQLENIINK